jgi:phage baseplate assembly protein gpV
MYLAYVKDNTDAQRMGRLKVWVPDFGSLPTDESSWVTVSYVSPFAGATDPNLIKNPPTAAGNSQTSYGWWAVPPDLENQVVIMFLNGDPSRGVWLGCLYQQFMNHMVPGAAASTNYQHGQDLPVAEYNKKTSENIRNDITRPELTSHSEGLAVQGLVNDTLRGITYSSARRSEVPNVYGLTTPGPTVPTDTSNTAAEIIPGVSTASSLPGGLGPNIPTSAPDPSAFAGAIPDISGQIGGALGGIGGSLPSVPEIPGADLPISVPGVEIPTVQAPEINTDLAAGAQNQTPGGTTKKQESLRRKGGWTMYFDDEEGSEHMRIRSRNGSQLLIDDTNGLIYAINRAGTSWIQMDAEGNFDIFAAQSVSIRSQRDINLRADRDLVMEAGRNVKMKAANDFTGSTDGSVGEEDSGEGGGNIRMEALYDMQTIVKNNHATQVTEGSMTTLIATGNRATTIEGDDQLDVTGNLITQADGNADVNVGGNMISQAAGTIDVNAGGVLTISASEIGIGTGNFNVETGGNLAVTGDITADGDSTAGGDVKTSSMSLNYLKGHTHTNGNNGSPTGAPIQSPSPGTGSASGPTAGTAGEATAVEAFDPLATVTKTNVLATFGDEDNFIRDTGEAVTLVGRFLTYEPCPEHINKGTASGDDTT